MENSESTTISVKKTTLNRLQNLCKKAWSYDEFLNILLDYWEQEEAVATEAEGQN